MTITPNDHELSPEANQAAEEFKQAKCNLVDAFYDLPEETRREMGPAKITLPEHEGIPELQKVSIDFNKLSVAADQQNYLMGIRHFLASNREAGIQLEPSDYKDMGRAYAAEQYIREAATAIDRFIEGYAMAPGQTNDLEANDRMLQVTESLHQASQEAIDTGNHWAELGIEGVKSQSNFIA